MNVAVFASQSVPPALPAQAQISNGAMRAPPAPARVPATEEPPKLKPMARKQLMREKEAAPEMPRLTRAVHWQKRADEAFTSLHVTKEHKEVRLLFFGGIIWKC